MNKIKSILKSQRGQGVWEYMIVIVGAGVIAYGVSKALETGLVGGKDGQSGTTGKVVEGVNTTIDKATDTTTP